MSQPDPLSASSSPPSTNQVVELRRYALHPGARDTLIELFDREFVETQEVLGMQLLGQFKDLDDPDAFVWLRGFTDMETRRRALEDFYGGPVWKAHAKVANATMIDADNVLLLRPVRPLRLDALTRAPHNSPDDPAGLLVATIYPLTRSAAADFPAYFRHTVEPALQASGIAVDAVYVTEHSPNTFPALSVREGEEVFVWLSSHQDEADHQERYVELEQSAQWDLLMSTIRTGWLSGQPEVLRLSPTARSRWHR